jgi:predicted NBD/HSP70 family sugar kinase
MNDFRLVRAKSGSNQEGTSAHNRRVIIDALRLNGALSRADLARATRLTKQTVSNLMEGLEQDGLVRPQDVVRKGRGQPSTPYGLVPEGAFAIGLQIDRHVTRAIAVDLVGNVLVKAEAKLPHGGPATGVRIILALIEKVRLELQQKMPQAERRLSGLGVAMPGPFGLDSAGDDVWMMAAWQAFPLLETLAAGTGLEVGLQNDAAACATAERMLGSARGLDHAVCIYIGYGIGAGLVLGGELYSGAHGNAGEIGMALFSDGGRQTPLEHQASMASLYQHLGLDPAADPYNCVRDLVERDNPRVGIWVEQAAKDLRWAVHMVETLFDPQSVILSGGASDALMRRLVGAIEPLLPSLAERRERLIPRLQLGMTDPWTVALGAAAEPIGRAFEPRFSAILKESG